MTLASKRHLSRVADLGCMLCAELGREGTPAEIHHIRDGQGMSQRADDYLAVPLCPTCHRGPHGIHGDRQLLKQAKVTEIDLLARVIEQVTT